MSADTVTQPSSTAARPPARIGLTGLSSLMRRAMAGQDMAAMATTLLEQVSLQPDNADLLLDLSWALQLAGFRDEGLAVQNQALLLSRLYTLPCHATVRTLKLLVLMAPGDLMSNTPVEFLLEGRDVQVTQMFLLPGQNLPAQLPVHDLVFVAIGESDANQPLLAQCEDFVHRSRRPVLNPPSRIARLSREAAAAQLAGLQGVLMPASQRLTRGRMAELAGGFTRPPDLEPAMLWPLIARPTGSHAGQGLERLADAQQLGAYLQADPDTQEFAVSRFIDYRSADGLYRKYRVLLIDGKPFIAHLAISTHWMIHYLNAGMTEHEARRAEEAQAMEQFDQGFARRHADALDMIAQTLGLDYVGLDCAESRDGRLLVFEADTAIIVHAMDDPALFGYKLAPMNRLFDAFERLLRDRGRMPDR